MSADFPESDWRHFKEVHAELLERFCSQVLQELAAAVGAAVGTAHERYVAAWALLKGRNKELANAFDDFRRSTAFQQLVVMRAMGLLTDEYLARFSERTQEGIRLMTMPKQGDCV